MSEAADVELLYQAATDAHRALRYADAEQRYGEAMTEAERIDRLHPRVRDCLYGLACIYRDEGSRDEEHEQVSRRLLALQEEALGTNDPALIETLLHLGSACWNLDNDGEAEACYRRAISIMDQTSGMDVPFMWWVLDKAAFFLERHERYGEAIPLRQRIVSLDKDHAAKLPRRQGMLDIDLQKLAHCYAMNGDVAEAERLYRFLVPDDDNSPTFRTSITLSTGQEYAEFLRTQGRLDEADALYHRFAAWCEREIAYRDAQPTTFSPSLRCALLLKLSLYLRGRAQVLRDMGRETEAGDVAAHAEDVQSEANRFFAERRQAWNKRA